MDYEITPLVNSSYKKPSKYPLDKLQPGQMIIVGADESKSSIRTLVARFNQANGTNIRTTILDDQRLKIYREHDKPLSDTNPSKVEFSFWIASFKQGDCSQMASMYKVRFGQFQEWINELQDNSPMRFDVKIVEDALSITRLADYVEPVITPLS